MYETNVCGWCWCLPHECIILTTEAVRQPSAIPGPAVTVPPNLVSSSVSTSVESRAIRRSYKIFKDSVDPDNLVKVLYSKMLLTREERQKAMQRTETDSQKLEEVVKALERRISADPTVFHTVVQAVMVEPALEAVERKMIGKFA